MNLLSLTIHNSSYKVTMNAPRAFLRQFQSSACSRTIQRKSQKLPLVSRCPQCRHISRTTPKARQQPGDDPSFLSIVDNPPNIVRAGKQHGPGLIILGKSAHEHLVYGTVELILNSSFDPSNCVRTGDMASPTPRLEVQTNSQIRRPSGPRSPPLTTSHRPRGDKRFRLQEDIRNWAF